MTNPTEAKGGAKLPDVIEILRWALLVADHLVQVTPEGVLRTRIEAKANEIRLALAQLTDPTQEERG